MMIILAIELLAVSFLRAGPQAGVRAGEGHRDASTGQHQLSFRHFNVDDGLSQGSITAIVQDHEGFLWIGTPDGLNRFDGVEFKVYRHDPDDPHSLSNNSITSIYEDSAKVLWVGTVKGLNRFNRASESFIRYPMVLDDTSRSNEYSVYTIIESHRGGASDLWVGAPDLHLFDRQHDSLGPAAPIRNISGPTVFGSTEVIREDDEGFLWLGSVHVFLRFDPRTGSVDHIQDLGGDNNSVNILLPRKGIDRRFWIGSLKGLFRYDPQTRELTRRNREFAAATLEDHLGRIWIGTTDGLERLESEDTGWAGIVHARHNDALPSSLSDNYIHSLYEDASGALWVGTYNGLNLLDEISPGFTLYRHHPGNPNSLGDDFVLPIIEDNSGDIWFGTFGGGVSVLRHGESAEPHFTHFRHDTGSAGGICSDNVRSLLQDRTGTVWIGTDQGLSLYDPVGKKMTRYPKIPPWDSLNFWVKSFCEAHDGTVWISTPSAGMIKAERRYNTAVDRPPKSSVRRTGSDNRGDLTFTKFPLFDGAGHEQRPDANVLIEDRMHMLWSGTDGDGLIGINPQSNRHVQYLHDQNDPASISDNTIWSILEDTSAGADILWVGTSDGLNRFDTRSGKFKTFRKQTGFPNAFVYGILRDDAGRLWLSTNHGLTRFDDRQPEGRKFKNYDVTDGVQGNEFDRCAYCRLRSGEFMFGGTHGVTRFDPMKMRDNSYIPPVVLTAFTKFGKKVEFDRDIGEVSFIELYHGEDVFSFEYNALNYYNASKNQYAYMMEGFDKDWVYSGPRRYASYTHLPSGQYVFRVKASNNDGVWNEHGVAVAIRIYPPFWATWWFRGGVGLAVISVLVAAYRWRLERLRGEQVIQRHFTDGLLESQELERSRIAGELHDSLVQKLLVAKNRSLIGLRKTAEPAAVEREFNEIANAMSDAIGEVREIAHNLRPYQLDRLGLTKAIRSLVNELQESSSIKFLMESDDIDTYLPPEKSILLYRIVQEATTNILKHSGATEASVVLQKEPASIALTIRDNGRGFQQDGADIADKGFGLSGISQRVRMLEGTLAIESAPASGTMIRVRFPSSREPA